MSSQVEKRSAQARKQAIREFAQGIGYKNASVSDVMQGGLNVSVLFKLVRDQDTRSFVLRVPKSEEQRRLTQEALQQEYDGIAATGEGIGFRFRTIDEQKD